MQLYTESQPTTDVRAADWEDYLYFSDDSMTGQGGSLVFNGDNGSVSSKTGADFITVSGAPINSQAFRDYVSEDMVGMYADPDDGRFRIGPSWWKEGSQTLDKFLQGSLQEVRISGAPLDQADWLIPAPTAYAGEFGSNEAYALKHPDNYNIVLLPDTQNTVEFCPEVMYTAIDQLIDTADANYKNLEGSAATGVEGIYRLTKVTGSVTVTITTRAASAGPEEPAYTPVAAGDARVTGYYDATGSLGLKLAGRYNSGAMSADGGSLEIVQYNPANGFAYAVSGVKGKLMAVDLNGSLDGDKVVALSGAEYDVKSLVKGFAYGDMTSVAISPDGSKLAAAIQAEGYADKGVVALFACGNDGSLALLSTATVGVQPDMVTFADNRTILTANEGDSRADWEGLDNEAEGKTAPTGNVKLEEKVVWFNANLWDDLDESKAYVFGGRSFSIYEVTETGLTLVYDSGSDFEEITAEQLPDYFNASNDKISLDNRSGKKGPEPETVVTGTVDSVQNGAVTVTPKNAARGDTVTTTVKPDSGYALEKLTVTDRNGDAVKLTEKSGRYTFVMPAGKVSAEAAFAALPVR